MGFGIHFTQEGITIARGFSESQKEKIRSQLIREGKQLFGKFGLKKTNIAQLTDAAGISPATFYKFFESKEELYFVIYEEEATKVQSLMLEQITNPDSKSLTHNLQDSLTMVLNLYKENPFMEHFFLGSGLNQILLTIDKSDIHSHVSDIYKNFAPTFENLQKEGKLIDVEPKILITIMQFIFLLNEHRNNYDSEIFDQAMNILVKWIAEGFTSAIKKS